jgi:peptide/nickel transport system substrate-binding protein
VDSNIPFSIRIKNNMKVLLRGATSYFNFFFKGLGDKKALKNGLQSQVEQQKKFDKKLVYSLSKSRFPTLRQFKYLKRYLSPLEKRVLNISIILLLCSTVFLGVRFYYVNLEIVPLRSGDYREALVGSPQMVNPLFSGRNDVDEDLIQLIFSSLFKRGVNSELSKDLVEDFFVSSDSKVYDLVLRQDAKWHDGSPLTAYDVAFTFSAITDPLYKSSLRQTFVGVKIEVIDDYNIRFVLNDPYAAFLDLLTFGILPANLWSQIQPESATLATLNLKPIGSGPYKFDNLSRDNSGIIKNYKLAVNQDYYGNVPYLNIDFKIFPNFDEAIGALNAGLVDGLSYLPSEMKEEIQSQKSWNFNKIFFPQITLVFLNQQANPALADKSIRQALAYAIDRRAIVNDVLSANAYLVDSPILANSFAYNPDIKKYLYNKEKANELFDSVDWKLVEISEAEVIKAREDLLSEDEKIRQAAEKIVALGAGSWRKKNDNFFELRLSTVERRENQSIVEAIQRYWQEIGVKVYTQVVPGSSIQTEVIRNRNFEALFYAQVLGSDPDPYAFWHSSQVERGFNIANYSNKEVDQLLEDARLTAETSVRQEKYKKFQEIIAEEEPVIFMYSPHYTYLQSDEIKGFGVQNILTPKDRFSNVSDWYMKTGKVFNYKKD